MMDWGDSGWSAGSWVAMSTLMIVFLVALIALSVWVVSSVRSERSPAPADRADELLAERFARGEIDGEEFTRSSELLHIDASSRSQNRR